MRRRTIMAVLSNGSRYAAYLRLAPNARLDDGLLDLYIFKGRDVLATRAGTLPGWPPVSTSVTPRWSTIQVRRLGVRGGGGLPVHTDGEPAGQHAHGVPRGAGGAARDRGVESR